ncbi:tripartite tricarboxylate transporter substrate binding protein [Jannaschia sp. LMIT008]|uniref:Bug family tripartite tricarboxylate transporter substrate binding protein n=1 Tax=Jannaschia maritima TaxID=3032585 RepID=UPI002810A6FF|nr:tripartite tricarboxylate transporter substrate binding protein [Jannaschia sp. LMIT008]
MTITRRTFATLAATVLLAAPAAAQSFPEREVTLFVNYGAGGSVDRTARSVQPFLPDALGTGVVVENVGGAGGRTGLRRFMEMDHDGHTVLVAFAPATTYGKFREPGLFEMDDLAVLNVQWIDPAILLARTDAGWDSLADMVAWARENPGELTFGSSGQGSVGTILAEAMFDALGLDVRTVPYSGGGDARRAFAAGEVQVTAAGAGGATSLADQAVPLGLFGDEGSAPDWPDAPSINAELDAMGEAADVPEGGAYRFFAVHSDVRENHPDRFEALATALEEVVTSDAFRESAAQSGVGTDWTGPIDGQALISDVDARFTAILEGAEG